MITTDSSIGAAIAELLPVLAAQASEAEALRRLPDDTVAAIKRSGIVRLLQPSRYGGLDGDPVEFCKALIAMSRVCGASGWVAGIVGVHSYHLGLYDDSVQAEVWGDDPDTWISSSYAPSGRARKVDGGYVLSGRWSFSSGSQHSQWVFVGGMCVGDNGAPPEYRHFLLPRSDYAIVDVWEVSGLCGTGSNDIVVEDQFVPDLRTMAVARLFDGDTPGRAVNHAPLYSIPWAVVFLPAVVAPIVGMARGVLDHAVAYHHGRAVQNDAGAWAGLPSPVTLVRLAEAASDIDAAERQLLDNLGQISTTVAAGGQPSLAARAAARRDSLTSVQHAVRCADKAYESAGPRAVTLANPIQRLWRDVHTGQHHAVNLPDQVMAAYGQFMITGDIADTTI